MGFCGAFTGWHRLEQLSFEGTLQTQGCCWPCITHGKSLHLRELVIKIRYCQPKPKTPRHKKHHCPPAKGKAKTTTKSHTHARLKNCADL